MHVLLGFVPPFIPGFQAFQLKRGYRTSVEGAAAANYQTNEIFTPYFIISPTLCHIF